ncbi:MAG: ribosome-associated translation inhibitor RaiA [Oligoflexia bacterium]|nr:ribosome-associated translation inhibitor RaiA [Oligoflexia bacterium]
MAVTSEQLNINVTFKNTDASDALRTYAEDKITNCLHKFVHHETRVHLVLAVEKNRKVAEISFHTDGFDFMSKEESLDLYSCVDALIDSLSIQLRKRKEKLTSHH